MIYHNSMKVCSCCNIEKDASEFWNGKTNDGLQAYCKKCSRNKQIAYVRKKGIPERKRKIVYVLPDKKICSHCNCEKQKDSFRVRWERRVSPPFPYLSNHCRKCETAISKEAHRKRRQTPEGREKNRMWATNCYKRRRDKAIAKMKEKRNTPEYKKYMKEYRQKNKDKIFKQEVITKRRYERKNCDELTDKYVVRKLIDQGVVDKEAAFCPPELIQAKRLQLLIKRKIKNYGSNDNNNQKHLGLN